MPYSDPEKRRQQRRARRERMTPEELEERRAYYAEWRAANRDKVRQYNRAYQAKKAPTPRPPAITNEEFAADLTHPVHGTANGYSNRKCRCDRCRAAWAAYHGEYMKRRREREGR